MVTARSYHGGCGTSSNALAFGGLVGAGSITATTEKWGLNTPAPSSYSSISSIMSRV